MYFRVNSSQIIHPCMLNSTLMISASSALLTKSKKIFCTLLNAHYTMSNEDPLNWFCGVKFDWFHTDTGLKVHVHQEAFILELLSRHKLSDWNKLPRKTPFTSGFPVAITPSTLSPTAQTALTPHYQQLMGDLTWLSISKRPDIIAVLSLLSEHTHTPSQAHLQFALHAVRCLSSTQSLGLMYSSDSHEPLHSFLQFKEATNGLNILCDANWGTMDASKPKPTAPPVE